MRKTRGDEKPAGAGRRAGFLSGKRGMAGLLLILLAGPVPGAWGQGDSATGEATARVVKPVQVQGSDLLRFGQVRPGESSGTVVVTTQNDRFATGGTDLAAADVLWGRAEFKVTGDPNATYQMRARSSRAQHDRRRSPIPGVTSLEVVDLTTFSVNRGSEGTLGQIGTDGMDTVYVGGTLVVPPSAFNGKYEGEVELTVSY